MKTLSVVELYFATDKVFTDKNSIVTVHSHVNHFADWHGGCTYCFECISPIAKGDGRDTLLFTAML